MSLLDADFCFDVCRSSRNGQPPSGVYDARRSLLVRGPDYCRPVLCVASDDVDHNVSPVQVCGWGCQHGHCGPDRQKRFQSFALRSPSHDHQFSGGKFCFRLSSPDDIIFLCSIIFAGQECFSFCVPKPKHLRMSGGELLEIRLLEKF